MKGLASQEGISTVLVFQDTNDRRIRYVQAGRNKRKAMQLRDEIAHRARLAKIGGTVVPQPITFKEYLSDWHGRRQTALTTRERDEGCVRLQLLPALGDRLIGDLKPADFEALAAGLTAPTARGALAVASKALADAVANDLIPRNPCAYHRSRGRSMTTSA